jgi:6-phosphogluconolactonase
MGSFDREIRIIKGSKALCREAADVILDGITETLRGKEVYTIALSGGSTPKNLYALMADSTLYSNEIPWSKIHFFWGDERHVPPDHPASNYRMTYEAMLSKIPIPDRNIHRVRAEEPNAGRAAAEYEQEVRAFFNLDAGHLPCFDCVLLGMGPDGHTASLFPGTAALHEKRCLVVANYVEKFQTYRITMTAAVLNNGHTIIFLVGGQEKAETLHKVLEGDPQPDLYPSQLIRPAHGKLLWLIEQAAASRLTMGEEKTTG